MNSGSRSAARRRRLLVLPLLCLSVLAVPAAVGSASAVGPGGASDVGLIPPVGFDRNGPDDPTKVALIPPVAFHKGAPGDAGPGDSADPSDDLTVELTGPAAGLAGGQGSYTITVVNRSAVPVRDGFTVIHALPAGQSTLSVATPPTADWACVLGNAASCTWSAPLEPGASTPPITIVVEHARSASGRLTSTATLTPVRGQPRTKEISTDLQAPPLAIALDAPDSVVPGATVPLRLTVTNPGPGWAAGFAVRGTLPADVEVSSVTAPGFTCDGGFTCRYDGALAPASVATVAVTALLPSGYTGGPLKTDVQLVPGDATASAVTAVTRPAAPPTTATAPPVDQPPATRPSTAQAPAVQPPATQAPTARPSSSQPAAASSRRVAAKATSRTTSTAPTAAATAATAARTPVPAALPFTGILAEELMLSALWLLLAGVLLVATGRRRTS